MHPYATTSSGRKTIYMVLGFLSVLLAWLIHQGLKHLNIEIPWSLDVPLSPAAIFGILFLLFDHYIWRWRILRPIVGIPIFSGEWIVAGQSSFEKNTKAWSGTARICQTWTSISIVQETKDSRSVSLSASLTVDDPLGPKLVYQYRNEPKNTAPKTMNIHYGTAVSILDVNAHTVSGQYYSGRGREQHGEMTLTPA